jgi:alkylation response protein AidB-like acyl-CoA dehydrogenase
MLAELWTQVEAARSLVYRAACNYDAKSSDLGPMASMARLFATDVAVRAAVDSIQIHGGYGFTEEYVISRFFREAKILEIGEGTNEIQHIVIARLLGC